MVLTREDFIPEETGGGWFDEYDAAVVEAEFGSMADEYASTAGSKVVGLHLTTYIETPDCRDEFRRQKTSYSIGSDWRVEDGGKKASHETATKFRKGSRGAALVERIASILGGGDLAKGQEILAARDIRMTDAAFYKGLRTHWKKEQLPTVKGGKMSPCLLPQDFIELDGTAGSTPSVDMNTDPMVKTILGLVKPGTTKRELCLEIMKNPATKDDEALKKAVFSDSVSLIDKMVDKGVLTVDPNGKFI